MSQAKKKPAAKRDHDELQEKRDNVTRADLHESDELADKRAQLGATGRPTPVHFRTETACTFDGLDGGTLTISTAEGVTTVETDGEVRFDRDGTANVQQFLERAFQAVA